ncbi:MAG TPA: DUF5668 domain-containing protein [Pseudogracilibacillus sp.]|nr:DUF5668 domain-containing protein [Pseudogracilibacillus sp.]
MKKQNHFVAYLLIGIGTYFLIKQLNLSLFDNFYSWPTVLIIIGVVFLIHSYSTHEYQHIFTGVLLLGLGIHFHGLENYSFWIDHWSIFLLIAGVAFVIRYLQTYSGLIPGLILIGISLILIFSVTLPKAFKWFYGVTEFLDSFWPIILIGIGLYTLYKKK